MVMQRHRASVRMARRASQRISSSRPGGWIETRYGAKSRREGRRPYYLRYVRV